MSGLAERDPGEARRVNAPVLLELCCGGIEDVRLAAEQGIERIELNCAMGLGGLTPSAGLVAEARRIFDRPIVAMVRPREGGFCYSESEFRQMRRDADILHESGVDGLAVGFLKADGTVDSWRCLDFREAFPDLELVFHRAIDVVADQMAELTSILNCGFDRVLTSGGSRTAEQGANRIAGLIALSGGRLEVVAAGGISADTVERVIGRSGCRQIHAAVREFKDDPSMADMSSRKPDEQLHFGIPGHGCGTYSRAAAERLRELKAVVRGV